MPEKDRDIAEPKNIPDCRISAMTKPLSSLPSGGTCSGPCIMATEEEAWVQQVRER